MTTIDYNNTTATNTSHDAETDTIRDSLHPSDLQEQLLAYSPIPSAILSVFGSSVIIYMIFKAKQQRKLTPYLRLLLAMSVYDILYSLVWCVAAFLRPQETSPRTLSFGNKTTCNVLGFVNELSHGTIIYQGMLGVYFLLTARYGLSNSCIARRIEPWMHIISIGYPLVFAIAEALLNGYGEVIMGIGCWVVVTTENCQEEFLCPARVLRYLSCAVPLAVVSISLIVNNRIIFLYARAQIRPQVVPGATSRSITLGTKSTGSSSRLFSTTDESNMDSDDYAADDDDDDDHDDSSVSASTPQEAKKYTFSGRESCTNDSSTNDIMAGSVQYGETTTINKDQARRLRLVSSQAVLFVACFLISNIWTVFTGLLEDQGDTLEADLTMLVRTFPIFLLQSIFSPLQGFLNMMVFIRPKYLKFRHLHKEESRLWVVRRSVFGEEVKPTVSPAQQHQSSRSAKPPPKQQGKGDSNNKNNNKNKTSSSSSSSRPTGKQAKAGQVAPTDQVAPPSTTRLPKGVVSDLTASRGDFDHVMQEEDDERWEDLATTTATNNNGGSSPRTTAPPMFSRARSSLLLCTSSALDIISENQESIFEAVPVMPGSDDLVEDDFNPSSIHKRWSSGSVQLAPPSTEDYTAFKKPQESALCMPARLASSFDSFMEDSDSDYSIEEESLPSISAPPPPRPGTTTMSSTSSTTSNLEKSQRSCQSRASSSSSASIDTPMRLPQRRMSPPTIAVYDV
ncbi:unnamed protein product [Cylindrotheca closterium]|uniref:Uncharacterized protein n=1 Tax=Cylindrotheca closterium TaxID=2856 RepID=A0AAD2CFH3_9STRA|nr:unnamed protein product [Cylindrotheca closterium]